MGLDTGMGERASVRRSSGMAAVAKGTFSLRELTKLLGEPEFVKQGSVESITYGDGKIRVQLSDPSKSSTLADPRALFWRCSGFPENGYCMAREQPGGYG